MAFFIRMFRRQILEKRAANETEKPIARSQTVPMHAFPQPSVLATLSSIPMVNMLDPMIAVPKQSSIRKGGCEALTTFVFRLTTTQRAAPSADARIIDISVRPTGRTEVR